MGHGARKRRGNRGPLYDAFWAQFSFEGGAPQAGDVIAFPDMARTLKSIAEDGGVAFYKGTIAEEIEAFMKKHGGFMRKSDLAAQETLEVKPLSISFEGAEVWELPPTAKAFPS